MCFCPTKNLKLHSLVCVIQQDNFLQATYSENNVNHYTKCMHLAYEN